MRVYTVSRTKICIFQKYVCVHCSQRHYSMDCYYFFFFLHYFYYRFIIMTTATYEILVHLYMRNRKQNLYSIFNLLLSFTPVHTYHLILFGEVNRSVTQINLYIFVKCIYFNLRQYLFTRI